MNIVWLVSVFVVCVYRPSKKVVVVVVALESSAGKGWTFNYVFPV